MKKKIRIVKDENGITWRTEFTQAGDGSKCIVSTKIAGFRRKIDTPQSMVISN